MKKGKDLREVDGEFTPSWTGYLSGLIIFPFIYFGYLMGAPDDTGYKGMPLVGLSIVIVGIILGVFAIEFLVRTVVVSDGRFSSRGPFRIWRQSVDLQQVKGIKVFRIPNEILLEVCVNDRWIYLLTNPNYIRCITQPDDADNPVNSPENSKNQSDS